jgi:hypothetical protein
VAENLEHFFNKTQSFIVVSDAFTFFMLVSLLGIFILIWDYFVPITGALP